MAVFKDGEYRVFSLYDPTRCIDVDKSSGLCYKQNPNGSGSQEWSFKSDASGLFRVSLASSSVDYVWWGNNNGCLQASALKGSGANWKLTKVEEPNRYVIDYHKDNIDARLDYWSDDIQGEVHLVGQNQSLQQIWVLEAVQ